MPKSDRSEGWFDPTRVEEQLRPVPPFMIGPVVRLSDGSEAAVVANHLEARCKPAVRLLKSDIDGPQATARQLDLRMCRDLCIAQVDGVDVRDCLFTGKLEPDSAPAA